VARCIKHNFDDVVGACRVCGNEFCRQCLVWPHGPKKPPLCVECALAKAGVRTANAQKSVIQRRTQDAQIRAAATYQRRVEIAAMERAHHGRDRELDLTKAAPDSEHVPSMAGKVRLLLLLIVVAMAGLGVLLTMGT
jgi:hypothetical protein